MPKNVNIKLQNVPIENRVHCYDATIIIDFLSRTFMPLPYFVKPDVLQQIGSSKKPEMQDMKNPSNFLDNFIQVSKMYEYYVLFRNQMDYTTPVETSWRFGLIIKKLLYPKNGWQFNVRRSGRAQIWQAGPVMLRVQATAEDKNNFKVAKATVQEVEVTPDDMDEEEERILTPDEEAVAILQAGATVHYANEETPVLPVTEDSTLM